MMTVLKRRFPHHAGLVGKEDMAASCATDWNDLKLPEPHGYGNLSACLM
jgi:hypothetical protein